MSQTHHPLGPLMIDIQGLVPSAEERERLLHPLVGGIILFSRNYQSPEQLAALCAELRALQRSRLLLAVDHEGGRVQRFRTGFTRVPPMAELGQLYLESPDAALAQARHWGGVIATELGGYDIDLCFAPVLDLDCGVSSIIGDRAFSSNPDTVSRLAAAFRAGLRGGGMAATGKHFPGHGAVAADSHLELPVDARPLAQIEALDLAPYRALIAEGLESVMMAHVRYTALDHTPASLSPAWIGGVLRGQLGFAGAVFCDDLSMNGAAVVRDLSARAEAALTAGCDMLPVCNDPAGAAALLDALAHRRPHPEASGRLTRLYRRAV